MIENACTADGRKLSRATNGVPTYYVYDGNVAIEEQNEDNDETARNVYGRNLITRETSDGIVVYAYNGHSDVVAICNIDGDILVTYTYDEFGNLIDETVTDETYTNFDNPYRYAGYEYIEEVKLYDLNARYYNPEIARFLSQDPYYDLGNRVIGLYEINVPNAWSIIQANALYTYCGNAPILSIDLTGLKRVWIREFVESHGGSVTPNKNKLLFISYGLKSITVTFGSKTKTYTSKDYTIENDLAYIDDKRIIDDFGTAGVGAAKPYEQIVSVVETNGKYRLVNDINCYAFAIGSTSNEQPGEDSGYSIDYTKPYSVDLVASYVISDMSANGRSARIIDDVDGKILPTERRIAVRVGTQPYYNEDGSFGGYDYHFMAQNSDGTWSEKHGIGGTSIQHKSGNPDNIPWTINDKEYYDSEIIYMAITD